MKDNPENKLLILEALKTTPLVNVACAKAGIARSSYYRWVNDDLEFKKRAQRAMRSGTHNMNDIMEGLLFQKAKQGSLNAITYYLSHMHPNYRKKDKVKVEIVQKNTELIDIPKSAFDEVLISKLPKKLRKPTVRKARRVHEMVEEAFAQVRKEHPGLGPSNPKKRTLWDTLPWGAFLKEVLEEEKHQK